MNTTPTFLDLTRANRHALAAEAAAGLLRRPAQLAPKFFYNALGSRLFDAITQLSEYTATRAEAALLDQHRAALAAVVRAALGPALTLVDIGAGNGQKAQRLFEALDVARYIAVDISIDYLREALSGLQARHPAVRTVGVGMDFAAGLALPEALVSEPALLFYPGSSIGNFESAQAAQLLAQMREQSAGGALLIGVDLMKPAAQLQAAYDDALGVTAAFNLNALRHVNEVLSADFDVRQWRHVASVDEAAGCVRMYLEAREALTVCWPSGGERRFERGERIHTEDSYKWTQGQFEALLRQAGFGRVHAWSDEAHGYALMLAHASI